MAQPRKIFYTGNFAHTLDEKNRLTIPSAWRAAHAETDTFLAIPNEAGYISVLPPGEAEKLYEKVAAVPLWEQKAQEQITAFFAEAQSFTFDKQGRVALSDGLLQHAGIEPGGGAVLGGSLSKFNIYSPEEWRKVGPKAAAESPTNFLRQFGI